MHARAGATAPPAWAGRDLSAAASPAPRAEPAPQRTSSRRVIPWCMVGALSVIGDRFGRGDEGEVDVLVGGARVVLGAQVLEQGAALVGARLAGVSREEKIVEPRCRI